jgi:HSP20 family molecular chaperone IbpA
LPAEVDPEQVEAVFQKGVLTVSLSKTGKTKAKKISVKST